MRDMLKQFSKQYKLFIRDLARDPNFNIGTLGPQGTSSEQALNYLLANIKKTNSAVKFEVKLSNQFSRVYQELEEGRIDYALVPAAYEKITDFFWNFNFINRINFIYPTPNYGIVCNNNFVLDVAKKIRVACCPAVENIIGYLSNGILNPANVQKVITPSTTEALLALLEGRSEVAVTNQTSFDLYKTNNIKFIFKQYNANIVWSLFARK